MRRAILVFSALVLLGAALAWAPAPAAAVGKVWEEGMSGHPFTLATPVPDAISVTGGDDQTLGLATMTLLDFEKDSPAWEGLGASPDVRMACPLPGGGVLVCGGKIGSTPYVRELDASGTVVWQYLDGTDGHLIRPFSAEPATFAGRSCVLISCRGTAADPPKVFAVSWDTAKQTVWQYGGTVGGGVNQLQDAFCATQVARSAGQSSGNVLIADNNEGNRVIEVRADDYSPAAPDMGYTAASIVWQYGVTGRPGDGPGHLAQVRSPQRLPDGDTIITDPGADTYTKRVICVRSSDYDPSKPDNGYTADSIVWSYTADDLKDPNTARLISSGPLSGTVLITDASAKYSVDPTVRAVTFDGQKREVYRLDTQAYDPPSWAANNAGTSDPRDARIGPDGALWIADAGFKRVMEIGKAGSAQVVSQQLDCGAPGVVKAFDRIKMYAAERPAGTGFSLWYSIDGDPFLKARVSSDGLNITMRPGDVGTRIAYKIVLTTEDRLVTPVFDGLVIHWNRPKPGPGKPGGGGKPGGSGNSGQSGVYAYPSAAEGGTGTSGTGTGSGTYGTGSGSGTYGTGTGASGAGSGSSSAASSVEVPVQSTGSGQAVPVQGYQVQGEEGVSGVPLRAAPGAQAPEPKRPGPPVPVLALVAAGLFAAAAFFVPWPFVASGMRRITGFDHTRPAGFMPFRPLGK